MQVFVPLALVWFPTLLYWWRQKGTFHPRWWRWHPVTAWAQSHFNGTPLAWYWRGILFLAWVGLVASYRWPWLLGIFWWCWAPAPVLWLSVREQWLCHRTWGWRILEPGGRLESLGKSDLKGGLNQTDYAPMVFLVMDHELGEAVNSEARQQLIQWRIAPGLYKAPSTNENMVLADNLGLWRHLVGTQHPTLVQHLMEKLSAVEGGKVSPPIPDLPASAPVEPEETEPPPQKSARREKERRYN